MVRPKAVANDGALHALAMQVVCPTVVRRVVRE
jgi:hypothetical protein